MTELDKALDKLNKTIKGLKTAVQETKQHVAKLKREQDNALGRRHLRVIH